MGLALFPLVACAGTLIFDGETLAGWHADVPAADDDGGPRLLRGAGRDAHDLGSPNGHLITDAGHANYRLEVEYRGPGDTGNCSVLVHASTPRHLYGMFPKSIELQMHHGNAGDFWCIGEDIVVDDMAERRGFQEWGVVEGKRRRIKNLTTDPGEPGEWNTMVIEEGRVIRVWVNGDKVNEGGTTATRGRSRSRRRARRWRSGASNSPRQDTRPGSQPGRAPPARPAGTTIPPP